MQKYKERSIRGRIYTSKKHIYSNEINIERSMTKYIRRWIFILKEIRKKAEKYTNREDIRGYFLS